MSTLSSVLNVSSRQIWIYEHKMLRHLTARERCTLSHCLSHAATHAVREVHERPSAWTRNPETLFAIETCRRISMNQ